MAKTSKSINYNQFKIEKLNQENIQSAISKAQAYVKGKAISYWNDYDLFEKRIEPITVASFNRIYKTFLCNAEDSDVICKVKLVYSSYEGFLSIIPADKDGDFQSLESYVNINTEIDNASMNEKEVKLYNNQVLKVFKSIKYHI